MLAEVKRTMYEQSENFNKEQLRMCQTEIIELKITIIKLKNSIEVFNIKLCQVQKIISELEDRVVEFIQIRGAKIKNEK